MTTPFQFIVQPDKTLAISTFDLPTDLSIRQAVELLVACDVKATVSEDKCLVRLIDHTWAGNTEPTTSGHLIPIPVGGKSTTLTKLRSDITYILYAYSCIDWEYISDESFISDTNTRDMPLRRVIDMEAFYSRDRYKNWTAMVRNWLQGLPSAMGGMTFYTHEIEAWQDSMGIKVGDDAYWDGMAKAVVRIAKGVKREV